jgi:hypothetical protein
MNTEDQKNPGEYARMESVSRLLAKSDLQVGGTRMALRSYAEDPLSGLPPWPPQAAK